MVRAIFKIEILKIALTSYLIALTVIFQIEGVLNSKPLLYASSNDNKFLTHAHFLIGSALASYPEVDLTEVPVNWLTF